MRQKSEKSEINQHNKTFRFICVLQEKKTVPPLRHSGGLHSCGIPLGKSPSRVFRETEEEKKETLERS